MKKYILTCLSAIALLGTMTSCEDFLDKPALNYVNDDDKFWRNEDDFRTYSIEFYPWFFTGYNTSYGTNYTPLRGYTFNDDISTRGVQTNFSSTIPGKLSVVVNPDKLLDQSWYKEYNGERWNFGWVHKANVMIARLDTYKSRLSEAAYNHWMAVARFFRAYAYYNLVISFGDVPYFEREVQSVEKAELYKDRDSRGYVMDKVYDDLVFAMENAYIMDKGSTQYLNKYVIAALTSRFMLFEGTWQKYHLNDGERAKKYLDLCVKSAEMVMNTNKYNCSKDFRSIFGSEDLAGHPEVIFYRNYTTAKAMHSIASYSNGIEYETSPNLELLKAFICNDGQPYQNSTLATAKDFSLKEMAKTRDPRFEATFYNFPHEKSYTMIYADKFTSRLGASFYNNAGNLPKQFGGNENTNDAPIIRYAEVLLAWIEAKAELAETYGGTPVTQADLDKSINIIRKRPLDDIAKENGVKQTAPMQLAALPNDPAKDADVSKLLWEIRRERRMEFVYEHTRLLDIKRWKKLSYMDNNKYPDTMFGAWVNFPVDLPKYLTDKRIGKLIVRTADGTEIVFDGTNADKMIGFYKIEDVKPRDQFDEAKMYVSPVGRQDIQEYEDHGFTLTQTAAWR